MQIILETYLRNLILEVYYSKLRSFNFKFHSLLKSFSYMFF
jgi:hypothetical protein